MKFMERRSISDCHNIKAAWQAGKPTIVVMQFESLASATKGRLSKIMPDWEDLRGEDDKIFLLSRKRRNTV